MPRSARSIREGDALVRAFALAALTAVVVLPRITHADPVPLNVLLVTDGLSPQEDDIENHFLDLGYAVTRVKDYRVNGSTSFAAYDLIVLTESAPLVPACGLNAIKASGKPVLVVETWSFLYAYRLGLTTSPLAGLADDDTVTAVREGYDDFTSRVGAEALVYQPHALIFGVNPNRVKSGVTPIFRSTGCVPRVAVLADYTRKIAVTGITDTAKYTVDAWKMLDILIWQLVPPPRFESFDEVAQAYVDSGLYTLAADIEADLKRDPQSWTFEEAEKEAWLVATEWHLNEMWDTMMIDLGGAFGVSPDLPSFKVSDFMVLPERPHGNSAGFLPSVYADEHEHWFMGQYWDSDGDIVRFPYRYSAYYDGTDLGLGLNAKLNGRHYYYMGDTWDVNFSDGIPGNEIQKWSATDCGDPGDPARCDDMIAVSSDSIPGGGINASPVFVSSEDKWKPIAIPGVHNNYVSTLQGYWNGATWEPSFTVPTGIVATLLPGNTVSPIGIMSTIYIPGLVLWYGTAIHPSEIDSGSSQTRPASWAGCSVDGATFHACYRNASGGAVPFSIDRAPPDDAAAAGDPSSSIGGPARFIQVAAANVTADDFAEMCAGGASDSAMCDLYDESGSYWENSGVLLYGTGRPYRKSGLFLAFIRTTELRRVDEVTGRPVARYWTGKGWSSSEQDAASLTGKPPCDAWRMPNATPLLKNHGCWPTDNNAATPDWEPETVFGELSARLIRSNDPEVEPRIVLLNNSVGVLSWTAPLAVPWGHDFSHLSPSATKTSGYGPYIIDAFSDSAYPGSGPNGDIVLWHTISVWDGSNNTPYGVYTGSEVIAW